MRPESTLFSEAFSWKEPTTVGQLHYVYGLALNVFLQLLSRSNDTVTSSFENFAVELQYGCSKSQVGHLHHTNLLFYKCIMSINDAEKPAK